MTAEDCIKLACVERGWHPKVVFKRPLSTTREKLHGRREIIRRAMAIGADNKTPLGTWALADATGLDRDTIKSALECTMPPPPTNVMATAMRLATEDSLDIKLVWPRAFGESHMSRKMKLVACRIRTIAAIVDGPEPIAFAEIGRALNPGRCHSTILDMYARAKSQGATA